MKLAIIGATGLVGQTLIKVLSEINLQPTELLLSASTNSIGNKIDYSGQQWVVQSIESCLEKQPDIAIFSAGSEVSTIWAPRFAEKGCYVIDNSSAWRMQMEVPLVVPEINKTSINETTKIIANPNCSTIQMVLALFPIHRVNTIRKIVVSTYQSVSGSGIKGIDQLKKERQGQAAEAFYPHPIDLNCLPHGGTFEPNGSTTEESKLVNETRKILGDQYIEIHATVVRVPVINCHSESVYIECENPINPAKATELLAEQTGIIVQDNQIENNYPMPLQAAGRNEVFVGRIRQNPDNRNSLNLWVVSDNLRKGAATNAAQIAQYIAEHFV